MRGILARSGIVLFLLLVIYGFLRLPDVVSYMMPRKSIAVLAWPNVIDSAYLSDFEEKTGIKVYLTFFENYEELLIKLRSGTGDYDLIMAADYVVALLIQEGLVKKIDKEKLPLCSRVKQKFRSLYCDPRGEYIIPYACEVFGLGIDTQLFSAQEPTTWAYLFDPKKSPARVGMIDDAREVVSVAGLYLFGIDKDVFDAEDLLRIKQMLLNQKQRVVAYTDLRTEYLLISQSAPIVLGLSSDIFKVLEENDDLIFSVPQEGSFLILDSFMLPQSTQKDDLVYTFLNYLYQPSIFQQYVDMYKFLSPIENIDLRVRNSVVVLNDWLPRLRFFNYVIPENHLRQLWIDLKSW